MAGVDDAVASPMSLVQSYIRSKGLPITPQSVRTTLEQAARDPTFMPGLRTEEPPPADQRAPSSGGKSVAAQIEKPSGPDPNQPGQTGNAQINYPPGFTPGGSGSQTTSAQPGMDMNIGKAIMMAAPAAALGAGGYGIYQANRPGEVLPGSSVPPPVDPAAAVAQADPAGRYNPEAYDPLQRPTSMWNAEGQVPDLGTPRSADPLASAINRAVEPSAVGPSSPVAPMSPAAPGPGPDQTYMGNARPETSTTLDPAPIPLQRRKVTIEEIPHTPAANFRTRPPMRLFVP